MSHFDFTEDDDLRGSDADELPDHLRDGPAVELIRGERRRPWPRIPWRVMDYLAGAGVLLGLTVSVTPRQAILLWALVIATWLSRDRLVGQVERFARWPHCRIAVTLLTPVLALAVACGVTVSAESPSVADAGMAVVVTLIVAISAGLVFALVQ